MRYHFWVSISISMLAILASDRVFAKPQVRSKVVVISQTTTKPTVDNQYPQPVDAILASVKLKPSSPAKVRRTAGTVSVSRSTHPNRHTNADRSSKGIDYLINNNTVKLRAENLSAIDRWVDK